MTHRALLEVLLSEIIIIQFKDFNFIAPVHVFATWSQSVAINIIYICIYMFVYTSNPRSKIPLQCPFYIYTHKMGIQIVFSNPTQANFISQWWIFYVSVIPLHSCFYLKKISIKINVATANEVSRQNETWH